MNSEGMEFAECTACRK